MQQSSLCAQLPTVIVFKNTLGIDAESFMSLAPIIPFILYFRVFLEKLQLYSLQVSEQIHSSV